MLNRPKAIVASIGRILLAFWRELAMPVEVALVNRKVARNPIDLTDFQALTHKELRELIVADWTRAKELDEKLQKLTAALSVSVTIGGLVGTTLVQALSAASVKYGVGALYLVATIYMIIGVLIGFSGLRPKPRYGHGAAFMRLSRGRSAAAKCELVGAASGFQRDNIMTANLAMAATASIRNGIVVFAFAVLASLIASAALPASKSNPSKPSAIVSPAAQRKI